MKVANSRLRGLLHAMIANLARFRVQTLALVSNVLLEVFPGSEFVMALCKSSRSIELYLSLSALACARHVLLVPIQLAGRYATNLCARHDQICVLNVEYVIFELL